MITAIPDDLNEDTQFKLNTTIYRVWGQALHQNSEALFLFGLTNALPELRMSFRCTVHSPGYVHLLLWWKHAASFCHLLHQLRSRPVFSWLGFYQVLAALLLTWNSCSERIKGAVIDALLKGFVQIMPDLRLSPFERDILTTFIFRYYHPAFQLRPLIVLRPLHLQSVFTRQPGSLQLTNDFQFDASITQMTDGTIPGFECARCMAGQGRFLECVAFAPRDGWCCANCWYDQVWRWWIHDRNGTTHFQ